VLTLLNTSATAKVDVLHVYLAKAQTAAVTGLVRWYGLYRMTAVTGGSAVAPLKLDTAMGALAAGISSASGATSLTGQEAIPLGMAGVYEEETGGGIAQWDLFDFGKYRRPITLNQNEGVAIVQDATAGTGTISAVIVFRVR
jgi:hypothetical protein